MSFTTRRLLIVSLALVLLLLAQQPGRAAVTLIEFKADTVASASNRIIWRTGSEIGTTAFRVWRGETAGGPWQLVTTVAAEGDSITGASYSYDDANLPAPALVWYKLQELANQGASCFGPVSPGQGSGIDATTCPSDATATATRTATPPPSATATATFQPSATPTPAPSGVVPTLTPTPATTNTPTAQATAGAPSPTANISPTPSRTPSPTPTFISVILVTSTPSPTPGPTLATATAIVSATATTESSPTPATTATAPVTDTLSPTPVASPTEAPTLAANGVVPTLTPTPGFIILPSPTPFPDRPASPLPAIFLVVGLGSLGGAAALGFIAWRNGLLPSLRQKPPGDGK